MATNEEVQEQQVLLANHRRTLSVYLRNQAQMGVHVAPHVVHGMLEAREQIARIKATLRQWGVAVDDHPGDVASASTIDDTMGVLPVARSQHRINPQIVVALIAAAATIIGALIGLIKINSPANGTQVNRFQYQVRVQAIDTNGNLNNAKVTIEMADIAPLDTFTDNNGYALMSIDEERAGKLARIIVEAKGYLRHEQTINLIQGSLPDIIKLEAIP
jgi:hypothetical protein